MKTLSLRRLALFALVGLFVAVSLIATPGAASASSPASTQQAAPVAQSVCTYTVKYGDTLWSIAVRYHTSVWQLMMMNGLYNSYWIRAGSTLRVPCNADNGGNANCTYRATFVADITVPDGADVIAGSHFPKIWRVRNTGTCTWGPGRALHSVVWVGGTQMGAPASVELKTIVYPGREVDVTVPMVAPTLAGRYLSEWKFKVDGGSLLGVGSSGRALYVDFDVPAPFPPRAIRIQFAPGTNSQIANGTAEGGQVVRYVLSARGGQMMSVSLIGIVPTPAAIAISGASDGALLLPSIYGQTSYTGQLPITQDYYIDVTPTTNETVNFALQVTIN